MAEACGYTLVSWTQRRLLTHAMGHLYAHVGTWELAYFLIHTQKPASTPETKQHHLKSPPDFFHLSSLLQAISFSGCPCRDPPGSAIWARPGAQFAVLTGGSTDQWVMRVEQYLNHFLSDKQDNRSNCFTAAYKGTQTSVDSHCFCYWNQRWN